MRYFAVIVFQAQASAAVGINFIVVDPEEKIAYQKCYPCGEQEKEFERFTFIAGQLTLEWKDGGSDITSGLHEIDEKEALNVLRDGNWERLCIGLRKGSIKTLEWLQSRGFIGDDIDIRETLADRQKMVMQALDRHRGGIPDPF